MAAALAAVTALNAWHSGRLWPWTGGLAALFLAAAFIRPVQLASEASREKLGLLMGGSSLEQKEAAHAAGA